MHQGAKVLLSLKESKSVIPANLLDQFRHLDRLRVLFDTLIDEFSELLHTRDLLTVHQPNKLS